MGINKSYNFNDRGVPEIQRLKWQMLLSINKEIHLLKSLGVPDNASIYEPGMGPGMVTRVLLHEFDQSEITSVELDTNFIDIAEHQLNDDEKIRVDIHQGSVIDSGLSSDTYDLCIVRYLFQHLSASDIEMALKDIYRVLKPNGLICVIDVDDDFMRTSPITKEFQYFDFPATWNMFAKLAKFEGEMGGSRYRMKYMPRILKKAGFRDIDIDTLTIHSDLIPKRVLREALNPILFAPLVKGGIATELELQQFRDEWNNFWDDPEHLVMIFELFACYGVK